MQQPVLLVLAFLWFLAADPAAEEFERILAFEVAHGEGAPHGWRGGPLDTLRVDGEIVHGGEWSARIERDRASEQDFSALTNSIAIDFEGSTLELRGFLRTEDVTGWAGLWLRQDGEAGSVAFDNMQQRELRGTTEWTEYSIRLPLAAEARNAVFGALLSGEGNVWVDDLQLLVDGKPVSEAPKVERPQTVLDTDKDFDAGSGVEVDSLTPVQIANLAKLGKVWGFLKYHHPSVTAGEFHWDYELFRVLPRILEAPDRTSANTVLLSWTKALGEIADCDPCAEHAGESHFPADLDWIQDRDTLGDELVALLEQAHRNRPAGGEQTYVSLNPDVGNPSFDNEKGYGDLQHPDAGYRILALFRHWNIIRYWFPYRDVIGEDWDSVLQEFLPRLSAANDAERYRLELLALVTRVRDGHANLWRALKVRPPRGECRLPVRVRFVEDRAVVVGYTNATDGPASGLKPGDVILGLGSAPVEFLVESWLPYYAGSNIASRLRDVGRSFTRGECGDCVVLGERVGVPFELTAERLPEERLNLKDGWTHDLPGETFRLLSDEVAYLKLSSVKAAETTDYIRRAERTTGLIIDIRNYPSEFVVFALGQHLVREQTPFARFTHGDLSNPGTFLWTEPLALMPKEPRYEGKVAILVDEVSMSQAEYTAMAFRSSPNAIVVGSTTAGADGNVSAIALPGGLRTMISGIGVFYSDKTPTQRVGIIPDVEVRPTVEGIRQARDEVLEEALRRILGNSVAEEEIRRLAKG